MPPDLPQPWAGFLGDLDAAVSESVQLHCIGGFAAAAAYGLPRPTADVDLLAVIPAAVRPQLFTLAGHGSPLHQRHRVYLQAATVAHYPDDYAARLHPLAPDRFRHLRLFVLDPYDLALTKLERNSPRDREDVFYLADTVPFDLQILRTRYEREMRPYLANAPREDLTLELWIDAIGERRGA